MGCKGWLTSKHVNNSLVLFPKFNVSKFWLHVYLPFFWRGCQAETQMYQKLKKKKNDYFEQNLKKASYLAEKATFNDLTSKKISKKVVTPKKKLIRLKEKFMWKL